MPPAPVLLELLFPESAESMLPFVSPRLMQWCEAFDAWLEERRKNHVRKDGQDARLAWRRLLGGCGKPPWEISPGDLKQHMAGMEANGYSPHTIREELKFISAFYRWRGENQPDTECPPSFNPAAGIIPPKHAFAAHSPLLSRQEVETLLSYMRSDPSALGCRDYALTLARLRLGIPHQSLQRLRWEQIEHSEEGAWLRLRPEARRSPLAADAWEAIQRWLEQSGRLPLMQPGDYIFTPLADALHEAEPNRPEAWAAGKFVSTNGIRANLKRYGRRLDLPEEKLTWRSLQRTAVRLRLEAGDSPKELRSFLNWRPTRKGMRGYLSRLPKLPRSDAADEGQAEEEPALPVRIGGMYQPRKTVTHGLYASSQPHEQVSAILAENIRGLEAEISALRLLERLLFKQQLTSANSRQAANLANACTWMGDRLARLIQDEAQISRTDDSPEWIEEVFAGLDNIAAEQGQPPISPEWRRELEEEAGDSLSINARTLVEEIACARIVLRNTFELAGRAAQTGQVEELIHLADIYGSGCTRLVKLLRLAHSSHSRMEMKVRAMIDEVLAEEQKDWPQY